MINEYWYLSPTYYKVVIFSAMGALGLGIILTIIGGLTQNLSLMWVGFPLIAAGAILHLAGLFIRARGMRKILAERRR